MAVLFCESSGRQEAAAIDLDSFAFSLKNKIIQDVMIWKGKDWFFHSIESATKKIPKPLFGGFFLQKTLYNDVSQKKMVKTSNN